MSPDLHLDPDAVVRLAVTVRRIADGLPAPPIAPPQGVETRPSSDADSELRAFAAAADRAASGVRDADDAVARAFRDLDARRAHPPRDAR